MFNRSENEWDLALIEINILSCRICFVAENFECKDFMNDTYFADGFA